MNAAGVNETTATETSSDTGRSGTAGINLARVVKFAKKWVEHTNHAGEPELYTGDTISNDGLGLTAVEPTGGDAVQRGDTETAVSDDSRSDTEQSDTGKLPVGVPDLGRIRREVQSEVERLNRIRDRQRFGRRTVVAVDSGQSEPFSRAISGTNTGLDFQPLGGDGPEISVGGVIFRDPSESGTDQSVSGFDGDGTGSGADPADEKTPADEGSQGPDQESYVRDLEIQAGDDHSNDRGGNTAAVLPSAPTINGPVAVRGSQGLLSLDNLAASFTSNSELGAYGSEELDAMIEKRKGHSQARVAIYKKQFELEIKAGNRDFIRSQGKTFESTHDRIQELLKAAEDKEEVDDNAAAKFWYWVVVNPAQDDWEKLWKTTEKVMRHVWIDQAYVSFEQRSIEAGKHYGFHVNLLIKRKPNITPANAMRNIMSGFGQLVKPPYERTLPIMKIPNRSIWEEKMNYMMGKKAPDKMPAVQIDQEWRETLDIKPIYSKTGLLQEQMED